MMKIFFKYLSIFLIFIVIFAISLLFIPPVTKVVVKNTLDYFLEVDADVTTASLSLNGLEAAGTLDQNDTFILSAKPHSFTSATVTLHYDGNVNTFSNVATVELPYIAAVLDATFTTDDLLLDLNASLLEGTLSGDLSLQNWDYRYNIDKVDLTSFRTQQHYPLAKYATGQLSVEGSGMIETPYTVGFTLQSHSLKLEQNATALISPTLENPLPLDLAINGSVGTDDFNSTLTLQSTLIDVNITKLYYDFNQSLFSVSLDLANHKETIVPLKHATLDLNGSVGENDLNASYLLGIDDYQLKTNKVHFDFNTSDVNLDYRITSLKKRPLNLQGINALFGDVSYGNDNLSVMMDSKSLNSPILLSLKNNQLHLISNNMPLKTLQTMANQEVIVRGNMSLEADANLSSTPLLWKTEIQSKDLKLPWKYRKDIGLKNDLALTLKAYNEKSGDIVVRPTLWSNIAILNYSALRYKPNLQLLFFNINAKKVKTTYYRAPRLNIKGALNLKKSRLNKTTLTSPYEKVVIHRLNYSDNEVKSHIDFKLSRLDRFARLNRNYTFSATTYLNHTLKQTTVELSSKELGSLSLKYRNKVLTLTGRALPIEEVMTLTDQVVILKGDLAYKLRYSSSSIKAELTSEKLRGYGDLNRSIRPFSLSFESTLKYNKERYRGHASIKTDNETIKVSNVVVNLSKNRFKSRYVLEIAALQSNTFILPKELKGPLHVHGNFEQDKSQHLTFNLVDFQLPTEWHQKLDATATTPLKTNASIQAYNNKGLINFDAEIENKLLKLALHQSDYNLKTGEFNLKSDLKTDLWLKDTKLSATGKYDKTSLYLPRVDLTTAHETVSLKNTQYFIKDKALTTEYKLRLKTYANAPYHTKASIYGKIKTKPKLYATMKSSSLGGEFDAYITDTALHLKANRVSMVKLLAFSGQDLHIADGTLNAKIDVHSPSLLEGSLSRLKGQGDINITNMVLAGLDLDNSLVTLRDSQDLNLFQGSFSELPIVRSVKNIPADIIKKDVNSTHFSAIRFLTDINETGLHCSDCAIATQENLIALRGDINLTSQTFSQFYVGLLFPTNCAYFLQKVDGTLSDPQVKLAAAGFKVVGGATKSLLSNVGSVIDLGADVIKGTGSVVGGAASYVPVVGETTDKTLTKITDTPKNISTATTQCTPFYTGVIKHPKSIAKGMLTK